MIKYHYPEERIAIVAMGGIFPDAKKLNNLWDNIINKKVSIREVPDELLDKKALYRSDAFGKHNKNDKTYTKIAAIPEEINYLELCRKYKIPPAVAEQMDPNQQASIYSVDQALSKLKSKLPRDRTAVIFASGDPGKRYNDANRRIYFSIIENYIRNHPEIKNSQINKKIQSVFDEISSDVLNITLPVTEDTSPGYLQNITASRISNIFDLYGPSYTVNAACASALAATAQGVSGLLNHEYDAVITGGFEITLSDFNLVAFSAINALSPDGEYPFDSRANGFVVGLGGGALVLKRLSDALRDGDDIISLISGYGQGSDGKGKYIAAPSEDGQVKVIQEACRMANYPVDTIELIEAHGTGTIVGDVVEFSALKKAFSTLGSQRKNYCGIGSIKSNIGHLRGASGAAGMIKTSLALKNKILPPTANVREVNPKLELEDSPFYIIQEPAHWEESSIFPRRANVSAYGFGGADFHICMEEFRPEFLKKSYPVLTPKNKVKNKISTTNNKEHVLFLSDNNFAKIKRQFLKFIHENKNTTDLENSCLLNNSSVSADKELRLAICFNSINELKEKWETFVSFIENNNSKNTDHLKIKGIYFNKESAITPDQIAFMFPGQASQYPNMLYNIYEKYPVVNSFYRQVDTIWNSNFGYSILPFIFGDEDELKDKLNNTKNTHPAIFMSNIAIYKLLKESGVRANYMIGHSLGEITSLYAGGMIDLKEAVKMIGKRGFSFDSIDEDNRGQMISVKLDKENIANLIEKNNLKINISNINSLDQTVIGGPNKEVVKFSEILDENNIKYIFLNVSHAFHTDVVKKSADKFYAEIKNKKFYKPETNIMNCNNVDFYPGNPKELKDIPLLLKEQITSPVNFVDSILKLYENGVRLFIETGPSSVLTGLAKNILIDKNVKVINTDSKNKNSIETLNHTLANLFSLGIEISMLPTNNILNQDEIIQNISQDIADRKNNISEDKNKKENVELKKEKIVYSGVSVGLPGTFKNAFSDDNFDIIFKGKNLIEKLTDKEQKSILDLNITRLLKTESSTTLKQIKSVNEVIQFAGKFGNLDMIADYQIDEGKLEAMTMTVCAGIAAGYEALKDAGIPLIREKKKSSTGTLLSGRLVLPDEMRDTTGIIFANGLFPLESVINEVSKYIAYKYGSRTRKDLINFYSDVIDSISDENARMKLTDWFNSHYSRLMEKSEKNDIYEFNHHFMSLLSSQANNRLAQLIGATGPNLYVSAACSSTASAVTVAEDMIRAGHADRMIVIGADIASIEKLLPWFGAGFLSMGSLTDSSDLFKSAVPFDNRRNGMILGSGAVGLVLEKEEDVEKRGMNGICRILGTHLFNSAGHQSRIDTDKHSKELNRFLAKMEDEHEIDRKKIALKTVYCSHETYSPKNGGCAETEKIALESAFEEKYREIKVINTKGFTGHTMGASIEDAVSAKALQYQKIPPIANYREPDPSLNGLNLSEGGSYNFDYILRSVIAFGGQGNYHLLQRIAKGDDRIVNKGKYNTWLNKISASNDAKLKHEGRILTIGEENKSSEMQKNKDGLNSSVKTELKNKQKDKLKSINNPNITKSNQETSATSLEEINKDVLDIYSQVTKYPIEMLEPDMELEADLGIDTVKQATIFSMIAEKYALSEDETVSLSNYPTIGHVIEMLSEKKGNKKERTESNREINSMDSNKNTLDKDHVKTGDEKDVENEIYKILSEITKYPPEMLEKDMEMEADLGIDTVKQATIFSLVGEKYNISPEKVSGMSEYKTIDEVIEFVKKNNVKKNENVNNDLLKQISQLISEITKYPSEMLEPDMEFEADLGIDTIKQATIFSEINSRFNIDEDVSIQTNQFNTIGSLIEMVEKSSKQISGVGEETQNDAYVSGEQELLCSNRLDIDELSESEELSIQVPVFIEKEIGEKNYDLKDKNIWIIGNSKDKVKRTKSLFINKDNNIREFIFDSDMDLEKLNEKITDFVKNPVDVIVDINLMDEKIHPAEISGPQEDIILFLHSEVRFLFYKSLSIIKDNPELNIICLVSLDGNHGFADNNDISGKLFNPYAGAVTGFYKGLRKEWKDSRIKIIDLGLSKKYHFENIIDKILINELENLSSDYEIGYKDGKRMVFKVDYLDRKRSEINILSGSPHFVVTGGGSGITAQIVEGLSQKVNGKFTIIGRTKLPTNIKDLSRLDENELQDRKIEILNKLKEEGSDYSPVMVEKEYQKILKAISVYRLINTIENNGGTADYYDCDVRDYEKMKLSLNNTVEKNGPIDIIIHAAGLEKSQLITEKRQDEFRNVFSVKAKGLCNLYHLIDRDHLKAFISFSSISGRFGNEAQLDYCSANSFLSSFNALVRAQNQQITAFCIAWSGWKDTGMAWRNEFVKQHSEEIGINLIDVERGVSEFLQILNSDVKENELIISKGLDYFITPELLNENLIETPMIDWFSKKNDRLEKAYKVLSVKRDPIINNHRLGKVPLMPAVGFMEMLAEFHSVLFGRKEQYCFKDITLKRPLKLFHENPQEIVLIPEYSKKKDCIEGVFYNNFVFKNGKTELSELNKMKICSNIEESDELLKLKNIIKDDLQKSGSKVIHDLFNEESSIKLGSLFMDEKSREYSCFEYNESGAVYKFLLSSEQITNKKYKLDNLLLNPVFMDALFQVCGIHSAETGDGVYLPWNIGELAVIKPARKVKPYTAYANLKEKSSDILIYDVVLLNNEEKICYYSKNIKMRRINL